MPFFTVKTKSGYSFPSSFGSWLPDFNVSPKKLKKEKKEIPEQSSERRPFEQASFDDLLLFFKEKNYTSCILWPNIIIQL